jgi:hypothetical protein
VDAIAEFKVLQANYCDGRKELFLDLDPALHRNECGAELGGPIIENRLFFEGEYAGLRETEGEPTIMATKDSLFGRASYMKQHQLRQYADRGHRES